MSVCVIAHAHSPTNRRLGEVLTPAQAVGRLHPGELALGRLDVLPSLAGIERGLLALDVLERRGITVLNGSRTLTLAHDKLATATALAGAGVPHPRTWPVAPWLPLPDAMLPLVLKPRFGSWGREVVACRNASELRHALRHAAARGWFRSAGGVLQELIPPAGYDLRLLVAGGEVVGAVRRVAAPGEWRTNVALGGRRVPTQPSEAACALARRAALAVGGHLVGVDLLPLRDGGWIVLEVNGAVDFNSEYALDTSDVFGRVRDALEPNRPQLGASLLVPA
jgi:[lysine-biosynthesis-protein LysW]--L-2-aminoadipate ligase